MAIYDLPFSGYCAVAVAHMCGLVDTPGLFDRSGEWLSSCQTYEGGFGGEPGCEAHVRYVFVPYLASNPLLLRSLSSCCANFLLRGATPTVQSLHCPY
jgi:prenyltransferase beta subunit